MQRLAQRAWEAAQRKGAADASRAAVLLEQAAAEAVNRAADALARVAVPADGKASLPGPSMAKLVVDVGSSCCHLLLTLGAMHA
jgi:hypothetical protein